MFIYSIVLSIHILFIFPICLYICLSIYLSIYLSIQLCSEELKLSRQRAAVSRRASTRADSAPQAPAAGAGAEQEVAVVEDAEVGADKPEGGEAEGAGGEKKEGEGEKKEKKEGDKKGQGQEKGPSAPAFVPTALQGVAPLIIAQPSAAPPAEESAEGEALSAEVAKEVELGVGEDEGTGTGRDGDTAAERAERGAALSALLALSAEEEGACLELVGALRQFPEIVVGVAASLDTESAQRLANICISRLFNRWSCDHMSLVGLVEAAAAALPSADRTHQALSKQRVPFLRHILRAVCESAELLTFARHAVQGACMHELEFLLTHPHNDINVQSVCRLTVEPVLLRVFEASKIDGLEHGTADRGLTSGTSYNSPSPARRAGTNTPPPLILQCAIVGLTRSLGQARALCELSTPLCATLLRALVVVQQQRHARVLSAAGIAPRNLISEERACPGADEVRDFCYREDPALVPGRDSLQMLLPDGAALLPGTLSAGDKEISLLFRIYSLMKLCFTWMKQDRSNFCLSEMSILSRSRFLVTSFASNCLSAVSCMELPRGDAAGGGDSPGLSQAEPRPSPVASLAGMFEQRVELGYLNAAGTFSTRPKQASLVQLRALKPRAMAGSVSLSANELCFLLDKMAIFFGRSALADSQGPQPRSPDRDSDRDRDKRVFDFPGSVCRDLLLVVAKMRRKLSSIPNFSVNESLLRGNGSGCSGSGSGISGIGSGSADSAEAGAKPAVSVFESAAAVEFKQKLVYTFPAAPAGGGGGGDKPLAEPKADSESSRQATIQRLLFETSAAGRESMGEDGEGYGFDSVRSAQSALLDASKRDKAGERGGGKRSLAGIIMTEELSSLSWIINASRAALSHVFVEEGEGEGGGQPLSHATAFQSNFLVWKEIVDLKQSLGERRAVIGDIFADLRKLDEYVRLSKLYTSEIGMYVEKAASLAGDDRTWSGMHGRDSEGSADDASGSNRKKSSMAQSESEYYAPLLERCAAQQLEYELSVPGSRLFAASAAEGAAADDASYAAAGVGSSGRGAGGAGGGGAALSPLSNPLKILMRSVFPVTELRAAVADHNTGYSRENSSSSALNNSGFLQ
jgi:hypothetical protein